MRAAWGRCLWAIVICWGLLGAGCAIWRAPEVGGVRVQEIVLPEIPLAAEPVRSALGDVLFFIPRGWFLADLGERIPSGMVAVAVNPDYTLALTLVLLQRASGDTAGQYDLLELARQSFARRQARTAGAVRLVSDLSIIRVGARSFAVYRFGRGPRHVRVALFVSSIGSVYEVALVPLSVRPIDPPGEEECERIFEGVLRAVQF